MVLGEFSCCCSHLARLYKSLGEYDVLRGVFSSHIGAQTVTKEALAAEERGNFKGALDQYKEVLYGVIQPLCAHNVMFGPVVHCVCRTFHQ